MRSTWLFPCTLVPMVAAALVACSSIGAADSSVLSTPPETYVDDTDAGPSPKLDDSGADIGNTPTKGAIGSPLCAADKTTCFPDDELSVAAKRRGGVLCAEQFGGASDGGDAGSFACRVQATTDTAAAACGTSGEGRDEAQCKTGKDCAAGFDCIAPGVCRRYCCSGVCDSATAVADAGKTFCNLELQQDSQQFVPVCSPIKACQPLDAKATCETGFTCAVSGTAGATCVAIGKAQVGESCERDHCGAGLTCLGSWGGRKCYQLCRVGGSECSGGKACKSSSALAYDGLGVCETM